MHRLLAAVVVSFVLFGCPTEPVPLGSKWKFETRKSTYALSGLTTTDIRGQSLVHVLRGNFTVVPPADGGTEPALEFSDVTLSLQLSETANSSTTCPSVVGQEQNVIIPESQIAGSVTRQQQYVSLSAAIDSAAWTPVPRTCTSGATMTSSPVGPKLPLVASVPLYGNDPDSDNGDTTSMVSQFFLKPVDRNRYVRNWALSPAEVPTGDPQGRTIAAITASMECTDKCPSNGYDPNDPTSLISRSPACVKNEVISDCENASEAIRVLCRKEEKTLWALVVERSDQPVPRITCDKGEGSDCGTIGSITNAGKYGRPAVVDAFFSTAASCSEQFTCRVSCYGYRPRP
jgi:hypothetical protein